MRLLWLVLVAAMLAACGTRYPLGMAEEEWKGLSAEQRLTAREHQAELDRLAAERRAREAEARVRAEEARQRVVEQRRADARYGEVVQCVIEGGVAKIGSRLRAVEPVAFSRPRGEGEEVALRSKGDGKGGSLWAEFQDDGMTVKLCPLGKWYRHCARLIGTAADFHRGIERRLVVDSMLDVRVRCGFAPGAAIFPRR